MVRTISISALIVLSKMVKECQLAHDDLLLLLLTSAPSVDPIVDLIARIISQCEAETPTLEEALQDMIDQSQYYAFGNRGSGRREKRL